MDGRMRLRHFFGVALCCLLLSYAVGAKLALYHSQQPGAKSVASTKAWQDHTIRSEVENLTLPATPSPLELLEMLLGLVLMTVFYISLEEPAAPVVCGRSPCLSLRPPPTR